MAFSVLVRLKHVLGKLRFKLWHGRSKESILSDSGSSITLHPQAVSTRKDDNDHSNSSQASLKDMSMPSRREDLGRASLEDDDSFHHLLHDLFGPPPELKDVRIWEARHHNTAALAERVFRHPDVPGLFHCRAMVNGSCHSGTLLSNILSSLYPPISLVPGPSIEDEGELLYRSLRGKRYLIVLHGLKDFKIWDAIKRYFPDNKVRSRILLSGALNCKKPRKLTVEREDTVVGCAEESKIIDELTRPPPALSMVTIAGMGGIGKTTLARRIFNHPSVTHHFHCRAWIKNVSTVDRVLSHLLYSVSSAGGEKIQGQSLDLEDKGSLLYRNLKGIRYLIVVDDLWSSEVWEAVQRYLPDDGNGSRILITTRVVEFFTSTRVRKTPPHCLTLMDKAQSWELLEKLVFMRQSCPDELVEIGRKIAEACGGLPLAVVVIAGFLCNINSNLPTVWRSVKSEVVRIMSSDSGTCMNLLYFSYKYLPGHLKACFLYMGAFPVNSEIAVEYLLHLWVANGFLKSKLSNNLENQAEEYLKGLIGRNLVSIGKRGLDGKIKTCFIHPLVRQLCLGESLKKNFMQVLEPSTQARVQENNQHLIFNLEHLDEFQPVPLNPHLCSIIWMHHGSALTPGMVLLQMSVCKRLRVLDIFFVSFDTFPLELLNLVNLRFLALNVSYELDARISQLSKLETFVVYGSWGSKPALYWEFWKMLCLRNVLIRVPSCFN